MKNIFVLCFVAVGLLLIGCGVKQAQVEKQHSTTGIVKSIDADNLKVVLDHAAFADGFMDAMTMPYQVAGKTLLDGLKVGDKIEFTVTENKKGYSVTGIKKTP